MEILSCRQARGNFSEVLNKVTYGGSRVAVKRPGKPPVYLISAEDYELVRRILEMKGPEKQQEMKAG